MTTQNRLQDILANPLMMLAGRLVKSYLRCEGIERNHFLADELESAANFAIAKVIEMVCREGNPLGIDLESARVLPLKKIVTKESSTLEGYSVSSIWNGMDDENKKQKKRCRCQFADEVNGHSVNGANLVVDGDHCYPPVVEYLTSDELLSRFRDDELDDTDREMIALYASGRFSHHYEIADELHKDSKDIYTRRQRILTASHIRSQDA